MDLDGSVRVAYVNLVDEAEACTKDRACNVCVHTSCMHGRVTCALEPAVQEICSLVRLVREELNYADIATDGNLLPAFSFNNRRVSIIISEPRITSQWSRCRISL